MTRNPDFLKNVAIFSALDDQQLKVAENHMVSRTFPRDSIVFQEGDVGDALYVLKEGKVKVMLADEEGREVIVSVLSPGECFGEMALFDSGLRCARVVAMSPCSVMVMPRPNFQRWLADNPSVSMSIIQELSHRLRRANQTISSLAMETVQQRVLRILADQAVDMDGRLVLSDPPRQKDIASMVGASRERVNRVMQDLMRRGAIKMEGDRVVVEATELPSFT